jgi:ribonuclease BN (tRNA processing enzyme)
MPRSRGANVRTTFLGTGTPRSPERASAAIAVQLVAGGPSSSPATTVLLDTAGGNEILRRLRAAAISPVTIRHVFVSHQHFDHMAGLPILLLEMSRFPDAVVDVYLPAEGMDAVQAVLSVQTPGVVAGRLAGRLRFVPLRPGDVVALAVPGHPDAQLRATNAVHPVPALGCVLEWRGRRHGYTGDTSPFEGIGEAYGDVDTLIHESSGREGPGAEALHRIGHSTAADAGRAATAAGARRLVLTHYEPGDAADRVSLEAEARAEYGGPITVATDSTEIDVSARVAATTRG